MHDTKWMNHMKHPKYVDSVQQQNDSLVAWDVLLDNDDDDQEQHPTQQQTIQIATPAGTALKFIHSHGRSRQYVFPPSYESSR